MAQTVGRVIALLFHDHSTRRGRVVSGMPRPHFTPGKDLVPILQEAGWAPWPVWKGRNSRIHRDLIPDCPPHNLYSRLSKKVTERRIHLQSVVLCSERQRNRRDEKNDSVSWIMVK